MSGMTEDEKALLLELGALERQRALSEEMRLAHLAEQTEKWRWWHGGPPPSYRGSAVLHKAAALQSELRMKLERMMRAVRGPND